MADKKISQLTALSAANLAPSTDVLAIVDTSATETKKIVAQDLINGVLNVASAVGIGTASPGYKLHVVDNSTGTQVRVASSSSGGTSQSFTNTATNGRSYRIGSNFVTGTGEFALYDDTAGAARLTVDSSGNLGLGVTPSAWGSTWKAQQIGIWGALGVETSSTGEFTLLNNAYASAATTFKYVNTDFAARYTMDNGTHAWFNAPSGTAGNTISFTQAMTLDASGRLLVGNTADAASGGYFGAIQAQGSYPALVLKGTEASAKTWQVAENAGALAFYNTTDGERARITAGGGLHVGGTSNISAPAIRSTGPNGYSEINDGVFSASRTDAMYLLQVANGPMTFGTNNTERARITSGGYFKASNSGSYDDATGTFHEFYQTANDQVLNIRNTSSSFTDSAVVIYNTRATTNSTYNHIYSSNGDFTGQFIVRDSGNAVNSNNSYGAISDEKLKQDIVDAASQWNDIKGLRIRKYRFKNNANGPLQIGLVAQEAEVVSPGLVEEAIDRNAEGEDLGTTTKSVKYSVLYIKAVKALQEAMTRIEQLEAKVAALEAK